MHLDNCFADGETKTKTFAARMGLLEWLEDFVKVFRGDAHTTVPDLNGDGTRREVVGSHRHLSEIGSEFGGVAQDVPEDLLQAGWIDSHLVKSGLEGKGMFAMSMFNVATHNFDRAPKQFVSIRADEMKLQFAAGNAGEIEKIVDESRLKFDIAANHLQAVPDLSRELWLIGSISGPNQNGSQWSAQFVAERRKKSVFGRIGRFGALFLALQFLLDPAPLNKKSNLASEGRNELKQIIVRLRDLVTEHLDNSVCPLIGKKRKGKASAQFRFHSRTFPRKVRIHGDVINPGGFV